MKNETPEAPAKYESPEISDNWNKTNAKEFLTIAELKKKNPSGGIFETEGYIVASVSGCDCPPEAMCNCPVPNITISAKNKVSRSVDSYKDELIIWNGPPSLKRDRIYRFKVEVPTYSYGDELGSANYVGHRIFELVSESSRTAN